MLITLADVFRMDCGEIRGACMGDQVEEATAVIQGEFSVALNQCSSSGSRKKSLGSSKKF